MYTYKRTKCKVKSFRDEGEEDERARGNRLVMIVVVDESEGKS